MEKRLRRRMVFPEPRRNLAHHPRDGRHGAPGAALGVGQVTPEQAQEAADYRDMKREEAPMCIVRRLVSAPEVVE